MGYLYDHLYINKEAWLKKHCIKRKIVSKKRMSIQ